MRIAGYITHTPRCFGVSITYTYGTGPLEAFYKCRGHRNCRSQQLVKLGLWQTRDISKNIAEHGWLVWNTFDSMQQLLLLIFKTSRIVLTKDIHQSYWKVFKDRAQNVVRPKTHGYSAHVGTATGVLRTYGYGRCRVRAQDNLRRACGRLL